MNNGFQRFPDFGKEVKRPFPVHENCYDCAEFYDGCNAWPVRKEFRCADLLKLPAVMPGEHRQVFPPSRMKGRKVPRAIPAVSPASDHDGLKSPQKPRRPRTSRCRGCGAERELGYSYCPKCAASRKAHSNRQRQLNHRLRTPEQPNAQRRDIGAPPSQNCTKTLRKEALVTG